MKNLFYYLIVTTLFALTFASCSTYKYELGSMSAEDHKDKVAFLNKQEKEQLRMRKGQARRAPGSEDDLLAEVDKNSLLRIKESRSKVMENMAQQTEKRSIRVKSHDGYEAAYFYQAVNGAQVQAVETEQGSQMNLLLMNKTRKRTSYSSVDPYSVDVKIYLVEPREAKPGFSLRDAKIIRQVSATRLEAEGKRVLQLPLGFYVVDFVYKGKSQGVKPVSLVPQHKVDVTPEDLRGTNYTSKDIGNYAYVEL
jgi:hypothetical protein